jgi:hypothetical protein
MRLTSTGLGIGTSSPGYRLDARTSGTNDVAFIATTAGGGSRILFSDGNTDSQASAPRIGANANDLLFYTNTAGNNSTERMRLDSSGNLGLGVTPSAINQGRAIELLAPGMGLWNGSGSPSSIYMTGNAYWNSGFKYGVTGQASHYYQYLGQHVWSTAPSGTAGNAITFTQAMTLDASGNLLVGKTSSTYAASNRSTFEINNTDSSIIALQYGGANGYYLQANSTAGYLWNSANTPLVFGTNNTERARITSGGDLLVGDTSAGYNLANRGLIELNGTSSALFGLRVGAANKGYLLHEGTNLYLSNDANGAFIVNTNNTERARITSGGELLVGTTTAEGANGITLRGDNCVQNTDTASPTLWSFRYSGTQVGSITRTTTATAYNTSSDYRLKENIQPMTGALAKVTALKPCTYKWKADGSYGEGFIAHELAEVVPQCVTGEKDAVDAEGNPQYQGIDTSFLVATLTAAIQEQQTLITSLTARVALLEGN